MQAALRSGFHPSTGGTGSSLVDHGPAHCADGEFLAMLAAYRRHGGLAHAEELLALLRGDGGDGLSTLARWIAQRSVISFEWQAQTWLPLFQFTRPRMRPCAAVALVLAELAPVYEPWELTHWFARDNTWLNGRLPVDSLAHTPGAVLQAARADRFIHKG